MPNPLSQCDQKDFGIYEDYQEWAYIMPKKTGESERKKERAWHCKGPSEKIPVSWSVMFMNIFPSIKRGEFVLDSVGGCGALYVAYGDPWLHAQKSEAA
jgi:hypothetical protein